MATSAEGLPRRRKLALVIGNGNYNRAENRLTHSTGNARALSDVLKTIGFKVTLVCDVEKQEMTNNIIDFSKTINNGDVILLYFSGHAYHIKGKNYLIPIRDTHIERDRDVEDFSIDLGRTLTRLVEKNPSHATICILDCCSAYLLKNASAANATSEGKGLGEMSPTNGAFIQFACAASGSVRDNLFSEQLLKSIAQENVQLADVFRRVSDEVYEKRGGKQRPLSMNGLTQRDEVYLNQVIRPPPPPAEPRLSTEQFLSDESLLPFEKEYYEECKDYYRMTKEPLISVSEEIFDNSTDLPSSSLKFGIDENCRNFDLQHFMDQICHRLRLTMKDLVVKKIQEGSAIVEVDIFGKLDRHDKKLKLKMVYERLTEKVKEEFAKMKMFFMFLGPLESLFKKQKFRAEIQLNSSYNRKYISGHDYWPGPLTDSKDRGGKPYYCPVGWQRFSFYVTDKFDQKFNGWCIGYHGTKFSYGLSILLSGLKPATRAEHGDGVYLTPSINYACHPRYSEVKRLDSSHRHKFSKRGKYVQYVLECRVHPSKIKKIAPETLEASGVTVDRNISNEVIEWVIDDQKKSIVDFNDPDSSIICTGILTRVTDNHPGLLPESQWWFRAHLCNSPECCLLGINLGSLQQQRQNGGSCSVVFD